MMGMRYGGRIDTICLPAEKPNKKGRSSLLLERPSRLPL
jgi:hypothetical protein